MAAIYVPVRIAQLILSGLLFIVSIVGLVRELGEPIYDVTYVVSLAITVVVLFIGVYGSYRHDRSYLTTFALIMFAIVILNMFTKSFHYPSLSTSIVLVFLSYTQAELIRRGYH